MVNDTRARILQAAKTLAESNDSIQGVTISLESVAQAAGLTKPGLMYHFPNKEALMLGLVDHAAQQWHQRLHDHTGSEPVELSAFDRHRAYVSVATTAEVSRADYWIFSDALYHPTLAASWDRCLSPWFDISGLGASARGLLTTARFCADGAWMSEATGVFLADDLAAVRRHALVLVDSAEAAQEKTAQEKTAQEMEA
ncbi:MAG: TetR/AcrR family transcriptional regulator [Brevibacterium aurantiacum]